MSKTNEPEGKKSNFWGGFMMGAVMGGVFYSMLSTKEGREKAKELLKKGHDFISSLEEKGKEEAIKYFEENKGQFSEKVEVVKEEIKEVVEQIPHPHCTDSVNNSDNHSSNSAKKRFFQKAGKKLSFF